MPLPDDFAAESLYTPDQWYLHDLVELDAEAHRVVATLDTTRIGQVVAAQRPWPAHPKHLPGAVAVQMTGTLGNLHAVYVMGLRMTEGWVGYGTHLRTAKFKRMGEIGPPVTAIGQSTRQRNLRGTWFLDYTFRFEQEGELVYESHQTAAWTRSEHRGPCPPPRRRERVRSLFSRIGARLR